MKNSSIDFTSIPSSSISYAEAIMLAIGKQMTEDKSVLVYGLGVDDPKAMYGTLQNFPSIFGADRCFDTPLSEDALTGYGIGLAIAGFKPIHVHQRTDFLLLCCNQLINMAAKIKYLSNGLNNCPFVVRAITGRSWGQGSQHSQSFHSLFSNIPGLRVLTPLHLKMLIMSIQTFFMIQYQQLLLNIGCFMELNLKLIKVVLFLN